jgi:hypothetical protein
MAWRWPKSGLQRASGYLSMLKELGVESTGNLTLNKYVPQPLHEQKSEVAHRFLLRRFFATWSVS